MPGNAGVAWERVGDVLLIVHAPRPASDAEWDEMIASPQAFGLRGLVVVANGVRPSPRQRGQIQERFGRGDIHSAVLTDSMLTRGAVTALGWFGVQIRAFAPTDRDAALAFAGVPVADAPRVLRLLDAMNARVAAA